MIWLVALKLSRDALVSLRQNCGAANCYRDIVALVAIGFDHDFPERQG